MARNARRFLVPVVACVVFAGVLPAVAAGGKHSQDDSLYSGSLYHEWIEYLASDALEGRGTGQAGIDKAAEYIVEAFERYGVRPAGDEGTYFQNFTVQMGRKIGEGSRLAIGTKGRRTREPVGLDEDFVPFPFSDSGPFKGDVVFVGYGIVSDDEDDAEYNDYADIDVTDKVVLMLRRGPEFADFGMRHQSFRAKARRALDRDAAGVLIVNRGGDEDELYSLKGGGGRSNGLPMLHITRETADGMLSAAGMPALSELEARIEKTKHPVSAALDGVSVRGFVDITTIEKPARNIVGMIPGTGPQADEIIVLGGHYDHLGIRKKGAPDFDPEKHISNGADDNASGTAMVMTMARSYTEGARPNRSILLMAFSGEEKGLLGSHYFSEHPTVDLEKCVAMLNFDMVGRLKNDKLEIGGMRTGDFEDMVRTVGDDYGLEVKDGGGGRGPSDHTNFYRKDIPVLFFFTGLHKQYHRPEDDTPLINVDGAMRIARMISDVIDDIDGRSERPPFSKDSRRAKIARQGVDEKKKEGAKNDEPRAAERPGVRLGVLPEPDEGAGILIGRVMDQSSAERSGMKAGDRILWINKTRIDGIGDAVRALRRFNRGDKATVVVQRGKKKLDLAVRFGESKPGAVARAEPAKKKIQKNKKKKRDDNPHGNIDEDSPVVSMPGVRLGIMPTYGVSEGEGYEISGVVDGGAAAKGGMRDNDRIYSIGKHKVTDVYSYMDSLRSYKPGDVIPVVVIRDGKKIELKITAAAPKVEEAA